MTDVFIVGCGYVGLRVAQLALAQQQQVTALARSTTRQAQLQAYGIQTMSGDLDQPQTLAQLPTHNSLLYYFAPPPSQGVTDPRLIHFLNALKPQHWPRKIILISTTGVYGDCGGAWIDEEQPLNPQTDRARRRVHAETTLLQWCRTQDVAAVILRVPGIYGPERLPIQRLQEKLPVLDEMVSPFSNRIHIDDLARACIAAADKGKAGQVYNISDGHPTTMTDFFNQVADILGLPRPPVINVLEAQTQLSAPMQSYLSESKRLDNWKMCKELGIVPQYPNLALGLAHCIQQQHQEN
ncbi:MAG: SDR family oxidoreductase [Pseudomonadota bacterium]|nr:SDR family oxidoreductase [Pseudomonadota bacterium]